MDEFQPSPIVKEAEKSQEEPAPGKAKEVSAEEGVASPLNTAEC